MSLVIIMSSFLGLYLTLALIDAYQCIKHSQSTGKEKSQ